MGAWLASFILVFAVLASAVHASPALHDHGANSIHSHNIADSDHHLDEVVDDRDNGAAADLSGDIVTHHHMSVAIVATAPGILNVSAPDRQANLHAPGKILASLSSRPPIQPPSA